MIKAEVIDVNIGQYDDGNWYATSPRVPWLAAEGSSPGRVMREISQIAPVLISGLYPQVPFELKWHGAETTQ